MQLVPETPPQQQPIVLFCLLGFSSSKALCKPRQMSHSLTNDLYQLMIFHTDKPQGFADYLMVFNMPSDTLGLFSWGEMTTGAGVFPICFSCSNSTWCCMSLPDSRVSFQLSGRIFPGPCNQISQAAYRSPYSNHIQPSGPNCCYCNAGQACQILGIPFCCPYSHSAVCLLLLSLLT